MGAPNSLDEALLQLQANPPTLVKDKKGQVGNQKTKYADLVQVNAVVLSRLNELGVVYVCAPSLVDGGFGLDYRLTHIASGTAVAGRYPLKLAENPMQMGSAITYARRYVLLAITGVAAEDEDDDANAAAGQRYAQRANQSRGGARQAAAEPGQTAQRAERPRGGRPPLPGDSQDPNGPVGADQHRHMRALWSDLNAGADEHRDFRLRKIAEWLGLEALDSSADLTRAQADLVITQLRAAKDRRPQPAPAEGGAQ
jgi:hypothetical protein